jgi:hypothetical protein
MLILNYDNVFLKKLIDVTCNNEKFLWLLVCFIISSCEKILKWFGHCFDHIYKHSHNVQIVDGFHEVDTQVLPFTNFQIHNS